MKEFKYTITDPQGIHARPAGLFVKAAAKYPCKVTIAKDGKEADAKRILGVMSLGVKKDQTVTFTIEGEDEEQASHAIQSFMSENL